MRKLLSFLGERGESRRLAYLCNKVSSICNRFKEILTFYADFIATERGIYFDINLEVPIPVAKEIRNR